MEGTALGEGVSHSSEQGLRNKKLNSSLLIQLHFKDVKNKTTTTDPGKSSNFSKNPQ